MSLKKQIDDKLNGALKAKDKNTYPTLRLVVSAIKDAEIAARQKKLDTEYENYISFRKGKTRKLQRSGIFRRGQGMESHSGGTSGISSSGLRTVLGHPLDGNFGSL